MGLWRWPASSECGVGVVRVSQGPQKVRDMVPGWQPRHLTSPASSLETRAGLSLQGQERILLLHKDHPPTHPPISRGLNACPGLTPSPTRRHVP